jgi:hypothetical protein
MFGNSLHSDVVSSALDGDAIGAAETPAAALAREITSSVLAMRFMVIPFR